MEKTYIIILFSILVIGIILYLTVKRNYFNKHKYVRVETFNEDMTVSIKYYKREGFNQNQEIALINPKHVYNCNGYQTIIKTALAKESINPIDFEAKFEAKKYQSAINNKDIKLAFESMKPNKFDMVMFLVILNVLQILAIAYLLYNMMNGGTPT